MKTLIQFRSLIGVAVVLFFFLPFFTVSCGNMDLVKIKGIQMVTGGQAKMTNDMSSIKKSFKSSDDSSTESTEDKKENIDRELFAVLAFLVAIVGIIMGLMKNESGKLLTGICGAGGILFLILLRVKIANHDFDSDQQAIIKIKNQSGFYLSIVGFALMAITGFYSWMKKNKELIPVQEQNNSARDPVLDLPVT